MNTHAYTVLALSCLFLAGCHALHLESSEIRGDDGWVTEGESALRTNAVEWDLRPPLEERWTFDAGAGFGALSPLIADEILFVATRRGEVVAVELESGRRAGQASFGESIEGTPVLDAGMLFVPVGWGRRALIGYNLLRGSTMWKVDGAPINAGLITYADVVIAADADGWVRAYAKIDGSLDWERNLGDGAGVKASPVLAGGFVIIADDQGRIAALNPANGSPAWSATVGAPVLATAASDGEALFVSTTRGRLVALRVNDGGPLWTFDAGEQSPYLAAPAVSAGQVVFGASDGVVRAVDASSGELLWSREVEAAVTAAPLVAANVVYVGTMRSKLIALDRATGAHLWEHELDGRMKSAFAATKNSLIVLAEPKTVHLFDMSGESYVLGDD